MWVSLSKLLKLKRRNKFFLLLFYLFVFENVGNYSYYLYYFYNIIINVNKSEIFSVFCSHRFCCCRCCKLEQKNSNTFTHHYFRVGVFLLLPQLLPFLHICKNLLLFPFNYFTYLPDHEKLDSLKKN